MKQLLAPSTPEENCALEPIRIPGAIQPHGFLLTLDAAGLIAQASANFHEWSGVAAHALLGKPLSQVLAADVAALVAKERLGLAEGKTKLLGTIARPAGRVATEPARQNWSLALHRYDGIYIVELEQTDAEGDVHASMYPFVRSFLADIETTRSVRELAEVAAREISTITGFGRTLVYAFAASDEHGEVLAETLLPGFDSYLGQRFPAADIPVQARALYKQNRMRLIGDANYVPQPLIPPNHPDTQRATDLTPASLRSVSSIHIRYMKNMRTAASMSMSIVVDDRLWGLISCHHDVAKIPPFEVRAACEHIAQLVSLQIAAREAQMDALNRLRARQKLTALLAHMGNATHFIDSLVENQDDFLEMTAATGAAIVFEGRVTLVGTTPASDDIETLVAWLVHQPEGLIHAVDASQECPGFSSRTSVVGFCAISLSKIFQNYVIWFRPEVTQTIAWAGDPRAKLVNLSGSTSPRESFEVWNETVRGRSLPWEGQELEVATEFRTALLSLVLTRAEELANLVLELTQANQELEDFSYTVSHDLRAPLRHIHSFAELVLDIDGDKLSERCRRYVSTIVSASELGGRQVDELLAFAQMGRVALEHKPVDLQQLVNEIVAGENVSTNAAIFWDIGTLPIVLADVVFLRRAMQNLISNAIKFSAGNERPVIQIGSFPGTGELTGFDMVFVKDNGVGFDMAYADKLFGVFQRLHRDEEFVGTGIGLANVRRILERHGGLVQAEAAINEGATFTIAIPRVARAGKSYTKESPKAMVARMAATGQLAPRIGVRKKSL